jgi:hypothetical protein
MKKIHKKAISFALSSLIIVTSSNSFRVHAIAWRSMTMSTVGSVIAGSVPNILSNVWNLIGIGYDKFNTYRETEKYKGFREPAEIMKRLEDIAENKSEIRIYGQEKAKEQMLEALSGIIARIDNTKRRENDVKELRGNVVYLIGKPGIGKTKMCYAIADAFLKHPEKTSIFCHSESITNESELGTQLFKTISTKDIGERRSKNIFTGSNGIFAKEEVSPMLKHLLNWPESVIIIDEYEKMKQKSAKPGTVMSLGGMNIPIAGAVGAKFDNSGDEIICSIASTGKYKFMNNEVPCSKALILITTNETREELEKNFRIGGTEGGGAQRLNIIEFDYLSLEACKGIVSDLVQDVTNALTDKQGPFKLQSVTFDEKGLAGMANYIFEDKMMQGRAKNKLEDKIYNLFSKNMGKEAGEKVVVSFLPADGNKKEHFVKEISNN